MAEYDVVVIGGGHNGLVAATYLSRAGKRTLLLEATAGLGGSLASTTGGAVSGPIAFNTVENLHPTIVADLGLAKHGLEIREGTGTLIAGGEPLWLSAADPAAGLSDADRTGLAELQRLFLRTGQALEPLLSGPLPRVEVSGVGNVFELLMAAWRLRRLGRRDMPEAMRLLPMSLKDIVEEHIDDPRLQAAIAWPGLRCSWLGPWSAGGGYSLLHHRPPWRPELLSAPRFVVGGPARLADALVAAAGAAGVEIRTNSRVTRLHVGDERVDAVTLSDGARIRGAAVLSACDVRTTLTDLLEPGWLEPETLRGSRCIRARGSVATARFALRQEPPLPVPEAFGGRVQIGASLATIEQAFDALKYDEIPEQPVVELTFDETSEGLRAHAWIQYVSEAAARPGAAREALLRNVRRTIDNALPGFDALVVDADLTTPSDFATALGVRGGHLYHAELALDQALYMRPIAGHYDHRGPVPGLFLGGPGNHPGGGITGLPGKLAAARLLADAD